MKIKTMKYSKNTIKIQGDNTDKNNKINQIIRQFLLSEGYVLVEKDDECPIFDVYEVWEQSVKED